jgi:hypothetical protein
VCFLTFATCSGFLNVGGAELKRGGPAHIGFDIFETFEVGDVIGIGLYAKTRKLFLCKNGEVLRGEIVEVPASSVKELPAVRIKVRRTRGLKQAKFDDLVKGNLQVYSQFWGWLDAVCVFSVYISNPCSCKREEIQVER